MSVITIPGGPGAVSGASGGKVYAFNNISESGLTTVAPALVSRRKITFHNPGTSDIFVGPALVQTTGSSATFTPSNAAFPNNAYCTVTPLAQPAAVANIPYISAQSKTAFTISGGTASASYQYNCSGN